MGLSSSTIGPPVDPLHVFTGQGQVLGLLLDELYIYSENPLNGLRRLFEARSTCDYEGGPPCNVICSQTGLFLTQADWTVDTFVRYLVQRNPDVAAAIRRAGPLLYQILVHYGSLPFPVDEDKRMTCGSFLRGIYMLSKNNHRVLSHQVSRWQGDEPVTRAREPADDTRILFQSIATGNPRTFQNPGHRSEDDDEDLIDVLFRLGETIRERRSPKHGFKRKDVISAAPLLPSSYSRSLEGSVSVRDLEVLLDLIVSLISRLFGVAEQPVNQAVVQCIIEGFRQNSRDMTSVEWPTFRDTILSSVTLIKSYPNLLSVLEAFIEQSFGITPDFWHGLLYPLAIAGVYKMVVTSKIIAVEQLAQLFLIMCSGYGLAPDNQAIIVPLQPGSTNFQADMRHITNITTLLQTPDHLLIVQAREDISEAAYQSTTFCVYTGALGELQIHDLDRPRVRFRRPGEK
ncbi:hypothetical protein BKA58DRAFT_461692 [Alternaria rosae]|uniref:uncharacterized protein n=1 Tax=Alternaria rosae TaxID=1187941 RepID=UPI001E8ED221|nr:uncharacterized protein BKA58DRAFT_461692 [Alternaria rosae]KAH6865722.1 hypothetical protein BKA58DRAFT_461692 [Alternaria rosae]